jgi:8-oxo-dGTP diphosphatase
MPRPVTPVVAADVIIELEDRNERPIVLIRRANPPAGWAIPGGFVDVGETVEAAALREAEEETGLVVHDLELFGVYSDPRRDPRGHTVSIIYVARASGRPEARSDAAEIGLFTPANWPQLAFDHAQILADWTARYRSD